MQFFNKTNKAKTPVQEVQHNFWIHDRQPIGRNARALFFQSIWHSLTHGQKMARGDVAGYLIKMAIKLDRRAGPNHKAGAALDSARCIREAREILLQMGKVHVYDERFLPAANCYLEAAYLSETHEMPEALAAAGKNYAKARLHARAAELLSEAAFVMFESISKNISHNNMGMVGSCVSDVIAYNEKAAEYYGLGRMPGEKKHFYLMAEFFESLKSERNCEGVKRKIKAYIQGLAEASYSTLSERWLALEATGDMHLILGDEKAALLNYELVRTEIGEKEDFYICRLLPLKKILFVRRKQDARSKVGCCDDAIMAVSEFLKVAGAYETDKNQQMAHAYYLEVWLLLRQAARDAYLIGEKKDAMALAKMSDTWRAKDEKLIIGLK